MLSLDTGKTNIFLRKKKLNVYHFGPLLGFEENTIIPKNIKTKSPSAVDINRSLKHITIGCNCVNTDRNFDTYGNRVEYLHEFQ